MDIAIVQLPDGGFDIDIVDGDIRMDSGLNTAIIVSLFSDQLAGRSDEVPDGTDDRRGWWADQFSEFRDDRIGSKLWLHLPGKKTVPNLGRVKEAAEEALAWLVEDGIASIVEIDCSFGRRDAVLINVKAIQPGRNEPFERQYQYVWEHI